MDREQVVSYWGQCLGHGGIKQKGKRTHRYGQQCGDCEGGECIRGINGDGKSTVKICLKKKEYNDKD